MSAEEYEALFATALDTLRDILAETEPGTGMGLHRAFNEIKGARPTQRSGDDEVSSPDGAGGRSDEDSVPEEASDQERKRAWRVAPLAVRERIVLEALGDQRMSLWELTSHLYHTRRDIYVTADYLRKLLTRLVEAGELHEVNESPPPPRSGRRRRVYFRNAELSGPIADLEKAFASPSRIADKTGSVDELLKFGADPGVCNALIRAGYRTVTELEAQNDDELLWERGIGEKRVRQIRQAIERYRARYPVDHNAGKGTR